MDPFLISVLLVLTLLVGLLFGMRLISRPEAKEEPRKALPPISANSGKDSEKRFRKLQEEQANPPASLRPPASIRPPAADTAYDTAIATTTATSALDALLIRLPLEKQKEVARTIVQFLGTALHSGSRLTKREKEDIGMMGWLSLLDTLRLRSLTVETKEDYLLVSPMVATTTKPSMQAVNGEGAQ